MEPMDLLLQCVIVMFIAEVTLSARVTVNAPSVVNITDPFNVSCVVSYGATAKDDIRLVKLRRADQPLLTNSALSFSLSKDACHRYGIYGELKATSVSFTLTVQGAFKRDEGEYECTVYVRTDRPEPEPRSTRTHIAVTGTLKQDENLDEACIKANMPEPAEMLSNADRCHVTLGMLSVGLILVVIGQRT